MAAETTVAPLGLTIRASSLAAYQLYKVTGDTNCLNQAAAIADSTMHTLVDSNEHFVRIVRTLLRCQRHAIQGHLYALSRHALQRNS